jgi:hypothetical protein
MVLMKYLSIVVCDNQIYDDFREVIDVKASVINVAGACSA